MPVPPVNVEWTLTGSTGRSRPSPLRLRHGVDRREPHRPHSAALRSPRHHLMEGTTMTTRQSGSLPTGPTRSPASGSTQVDGG